MMHARAARGQQGHYRNRFFANARPEADFMYRSKAIAFASSERDIADQTPRFVFCRVRGASGVVCFEARLQIVRQADVFLFWILGALKKVDILHGGTGPSSPRGYDGQPSPLRGSE
jgi:hypothetical protein